jgi:ATP-binding cassette, subfamily G (WHITE), member 2, PDR
MAQTPAPGGAGAIAATQDLTRRVESEVHEKIQSHGGGESSESTDLGSLEEIKEQERDEITNLARQISQISRRSSLPSGEPTNSFLDTTTDPELDPNSESFNQKKWVKNLLHITSRDPETYPRRTAGVTFRNLNAYGFGTAADYQADVFNTWLKAFGYVRGWLGLRKKRRIDILRDFEGLVKSGEMLVVLGRPGRYIYLRPSFIISKLTEW